MISTKNLEIIKIIFHYIPNFYNIIHYTENNHDHHTESGKHSDIHEVTKIFMIIKIIKKTAIIVVISLLIIFLVIMNHEEILTNAAMLPV